jgi:hypothetical protein
MELVKFPFIPVTTDAVEKCGPCGQYGDQWTSRFCRDCETPYCCRRDRRKHSLCPRCKRRILGRPVQCAIDHACRNPSCVNKTRFCTDKREPGVHYEKGLTWRNKQKLPEELRDFCRTCLQDHGYIFHEKNPEVPKKNKKPRSQTIMTLFLVELGCDTPILESLFNAKIGYRTPPK